MVAIHAPYSSSHCFSLEADCQAEKDPDFTKIDRYHQHNRSSPAGPTTEPKVRSHEILLFFCARSRTLAQVFRGRIPPRVTPSELDVDQCARRFEIGLSIHYARRSDKDRREVQYLPARGLLSVFVCDNSSLIDQRRRTR